MKSTAVFRGTAVLEYFRLFFALFCWLFVWCLAFWRGRWPERTAAAGTLAIGALTFFFHRHDEAGVFDVVGLAVDTALFLLFLGLALKANRFWPVPAAGFQLIAVLVHFTAWLKAPPSGWAYSTITVMATWLVLITFFAGLWENELRRRAERQATNQAAGSEPSATRA